MFWKARTEIRQLFGHLAGYGCMTQYIQDEQELLVMASAVFNIKEYTDAENLVSQIYDLKKKNKRAAKFIALSNVRKLSLESMWNKNFLLGKQLEEN